MNAVTIMGFLGKDPETKVFDNGGKVCQFTVATNESYKNKAGELIKQTEWHNIVFNGNMAETVAKYFHKGSRILLTGKLRTRSWEDQSGAKKYMTEIVARTFEFVDSKSDQSKDNNPDPEYQPFPANLSPEEEEDDLPF